MAFICSATWVAKPEEIETVRTALAHLTSASREEQGNLYYQPYQKEEEPTVFRIFEVYVDESAFKAHAKSEHFKTWAINQAIPALESRHFETYLTLDDVPPTTNSV